MLYLIQSNNYLKIGYTTNWKTREKHYNTHNPEFTLLKLKEGTSADEKYLHKLCNNYRIKNEWYEYNPNIIKIFMEYKSTKEEPRTTKEHVTSTEQILYELLKLMNHKTKELKINSDDRKTIMQKCQIKKSCLSKKISSFIKNNIFSQKKEIIIDPITNQTIKEIIYKTTFIVNTESDYIKMLILKLENGINLT